MDQSYDLFGVDMMIFRISSSDIIPRQLFTVNKRCDMIVLSYSTYSACSGLQFIPFSRRNQTFFCKGLGRGGGGGRHQWTLIQLYLSILSVKYMYLPKLLAILLIVVHSGNTV